MSDVVELFLVSLAVVLGGAAFAVGAQAIRSAWRDTWPAPRHWSRVPSRQADLAGARQSRRTPAATAAEAERPSRLLRSIAAFEAFKALAALAAAFGLLALVSHTPLLGALSALAGHLGLAAREAQAFNTIDHWLSAERGTVLLGAAGYAALHLAEAWGLWQARPWGEALGAASGAVYLPFEIRHLIHRPGLLAGALVVLNLAVVAFLLWRLHRRTRPAG